MLDNSKKKIQKKSSKSPIMFPNAGPLEKPLEENLQTLEPHGFARNSSWRIEKNEENELIEVLDDAKNESYPYEYILKMISKIEEDGSVSITQEVKNNSEKEMPVSMGLHPYFKVPKDKKGDVEIDFGDEKMNGKIKGNFEKWSNGEAMIIDRADLENEDSIIKIKIPEIGTVTMDVFEEYESIWIWSEKSKDEDKDDFICIEPVMRKPGGLIDDPKIIESKETFRGTVKFGLEE